MIKFFRKIRQKMLTENKFSRYLIYAIGEIFLVVIGIYIAIQFNNWNIANQNKNVTSNNIELLIASLEKDSIAFNKMQISIEKDKARVSNFEFRLNKPSTNLDTLIKIVRYEYKPVIGLLNFDNDNTYDALVQSGEINLLNRELKNEVFTLYSLHKSAEETNNTHFKLYLDWVTRLNSKYPANLSIYNEGPISEAIWENVTLIELANAFNPVVSSKKNHYRLIEYNLKKLIIETNKVLGKLKGAIEMND
ncbi:hypothetical protein [Rasiella sp. SM2506]|uniref:hypothetical protein n=1 Tax=Rasiella sp. SM2506 TaxID=3423914 RepID=UPI003D7B949C